jgi:hypothetical protein
VGDREEREKTEGSASMIGGKGEDWVDNVDDRDERNGIGRVGN